ncbi:FAD-dependent oxidoreductase [Actinoallomurus rhizosphaericola]|uniref:FAD-dependent oxidoreductase n=1 Tax=Actinoallomurus rhizosphaericola TaxID=2952536 RepID=UPI002093A61C|nr:cyclic nucleotide-binding domain-containing thioredoxin-disulfide reductase [Actinoallomurus rhizosphaericola]MCO5995709.1 FAD-dependent oxidoreductase [Actinoallomurus rhizosphaericola]
MQETPDLHGAWPRLDPEQIQRLSAHGERIPTRQGDVLFRQGEPDYDFFVVLEGSVAMVDADEVIRVHGPGRFLGELGLLTGQAALVGAVVDEPGAVLRIPAEHLRLLIARDPVLGDLVLRAYFIRRSLLIELGAGLRIIGSRFSPDTRRLRDFAARNRLPHRWIDLEQDTQAEQALRRLCVRPEDTPLVILNGDRILRNPSNAELAHAIGLPTPAAHGDVADLVIVGAGPAGLAAAVYGASEGLNTVVVDAVATGGQAGTSSRIENYLGFPSGISGAELAERAVIQAEKFGARLGVPAEATALEVENAGYGVALGDGGRISARTVVLATGARYRSLDVPGLERFQGCGVYYAATEVEALQCVHLPVAVVGGGNSAGQAALYLAERAKRVRLFVRGGDLGKSMSRYLIDQIERSPGIEVHLRTEVRELVGDETLEAVVVEDGRTGERRVHEARNLFIFIGADPCVGWLAGQVELDGKGFIRTGDDALPLETSLPGVFAVGDVRSGSIKRVASAVGEGAMAVRLVHERLSG